MSRGPDMPTDDRVVILDFLSAALIRAEGMSPVESRVQAGYLLAFILALDLEGLERVASLCDRADRWSGDWRGNVSRVRAAIARYHGVRSRVAPISPAQSEQLARIEGGAVEPELRGDLERYHRRFEETAEPAAEEAAELELLDAWTGAAERSLAEFFELWELPEEDA